MKNPNMSKAKSDEHGTPDALFDALNNEFGFTIDLMADESNAKLGHYYTKEDDCFQQNVTGERIFCNPPYDKQTLTRLVMKLLNSDMELAVLLIPSKTDQEWFHILCGAGLCWSVEFRWIKGRVKFTGNKNTAAFPVFIAVIRPRESYVFSAGELVSNDSE